jgi:hypothetical protein
MGQPPKDEISPQQKDNKRDSGTNFSDITVETLAVASGFSRNWVRVLRLPGAANWSRDGRIRLRVNGRHRSAKPVP